MANFLEVNALITDNKKVRIPLIRSVVDGFTDEKHKIGLQKGSVPVEDGTDVTDHAVVKPKTLNLSGVVTDELSPTRPQEAWAKLIEINNDVIPVTVHTFMGTYNDMLITNVEAIRIGNSIKFEMFLESIIRVTLQTVIISSVDSGPAKERTDEDKTRADFTSST